jgi:hypothetical protein
MSGPSIEPPVGWRVCIQPVNARPFDREFRPEPRFVVCGTREEAERERTRQKIHFGDAAVVHIEPVYISKDKCTRRAKVNQILDAAGWPIQRRPPRPGQP